MKPRFAPQSQETPSSKSQTRSRILRALKPVGLGAAGFALLTGAETANGISNDMQQKARADELGETVHIDTGDMENGLSHAISKFSNDNLALGLFDESASDEQIMKNYLEPNKRIAFDEQMFPNLLSDNGRVLNIEGSTVEMIGYRLAGEKLYYLIIDGEEFYFAGHQLHNIMFELSTFIQINNG